MVAQSKLREVNRGQIQKSLQVRTGGIGDVVTGPSWKAQLKASDFVKKNSGTGGGARIYREKRRRGASSHNKKKSALREAVHRNAGRKSRGEPDFKLLLKDRASKAIRVTSIGDDDGLLESMLDLQLSQKARSAHKTGPSASPYAIEEARDPRNEGLDNFVEPNRARPVGRGKWDIPGSEVRDSINFMKSPKLRNPAPGASQDLLQSRAKDSVDWSFNQDLRDHNFKEDGVDGAGLAETIQNPYKQQEQEIRV